MQRAIASHAPSLTPSVPAPAPHLHPPASSDGYTRHSFDAKLSNYTMAQTYFPHFKRAVVEGGAAGFMCR